MLRKAFESLTEAKGASILLCSSNKAVAWLPVAEVVLVCRQIHMLGQGTILQQQLLQQRGGTVQGALCQRSRARNPGRSVEIQVDLSRYSVTIELCDSYCLGISDYQVVQ